MIPKSIRPKHIRAAITSVRRDGVPPSRQSKDFDLVVDGKRYPPKYVVALAAKGATGRFLRSDEFGGGNETNDFLMRLGFSVVGRSATKPRQPVVAKASAPAAVRKPSRRSRGTLRVARAWMNMRVTMSQFRQAPNRWTEHRRLVIEQFNIDPRDYVERVNHLLAGAEDALADAVLLPACAMVHGAAMSRSAYRLPKHGVVVAGALEVIKPAREYAIASRDGAILADFDSKSVNRFDGVNFTALAAISSTIKRLSKYPDEEPTDLGHIPAGSDLPMVLLDAGHHPYSDYYRRHSMRIAADVMVARYGRRAAVVLSSWQYVTTKPSPSWCIPEGIATFKRVIDGPDILDLVEISFSRP